MLCKQKKKGLIKALLKPPNWFRGQYNHKGEEEGANMKLHELKIKKNYFDDILKGKKTFEIRKNDRDFQEGDLISFKVVDENFNSINECLMSAFAYPYYVFRITYVLKNVPEYGLDKDYCILGIKRLVEKD